MNKTIYETEFTKMVHDKLREANRLHEYEKISKDKLGGNYWDTYWTIRYMLRTIEDILAKIMYLECGSQQIQEYLERIDFEARKFAYQYLKLMLTL